MLSLSKKKQTNEKMQQQLTSQGQRRITRNVLPLTVQAFNQKKKKNTAMNLLITKRVNSGKHSLLNTTYSR